MSSHYRCCCILSLLLVSLSSSSLNFQPHRSNQRIESSSVSLCIFIIHLNCFQRSLFRLEISRLACPPVTSVTINRQNTKSTIQKLRNISLICWFVSDLPWCWDKVSTDMVTRRKRIHFVLSALSCYCFFDVLSLPVLLSCHYYRCRYIDPCFITNHTDQTKILNLPR